MLLFAAVIAADCGLSGQVLRAVLAGELVNPDSYMRVERIRAGLAQGGFAFDVARDGVGANIHWSHLLDAIILLLRLPLLAFEPGPRALHDAAMVIGPLSLGALALASSWALRPLASGGARCMGVLLLMISPAMFSYAWPGVAHHHVLLAALVVSLAGCAGRAAVNARGAGSALGAIGGMAIWLSPESMPFVLLSFGALFTAWLVQPDRGLGAQLGLKARRAGLVFCAVITAAFVIDPPQRGWASVEIDRLSIVWVGLGLAASLAGAGLVAVDRRQMSPRARGTVGLVLAGASLAAWLLCFPAVARGPDGLMPADQALKFFSHITEMKPISDGGTFYGYAAGGVMAALVLALFAWAARATHASWLWAYAALCSAAVTVLSIQHIRFATYAELAACLVLPVLLGRLERLDGPRWIARPPLPSLARVGVILLFLSSPLIAIKMATAAPADERMSCSVRATAPALAASPDARLLSRIDDAPEFLYFTPVHTMGSLYHRGVAAFLQARHIWRLRAFATLPDAVRAAGVQLIAICPAAGRLAITADLPDTTLYDALRHGTPPAWLREVAAPPGSGYVIYQVVP